MRVNGRSPQFGSIHEVRFQEDPATRPLTNEEKWVAILTACYRFQDDLGLKAVPMAVTKDLKDVFEKTPAGVYTIPPEEKSYGRLTKGYQHPNNHLYYIFTDDVKGNHATFLEESIQAGKEGLDVLLETVKEPRGKKVTLVPVVKALIDDIFRGVYLMKIGSQKLGRLEVVYSDIGDIVSPKQLLHH